MNPLKKVDLSQIAIRELERQQRWIDHVDHPSPVLEPVKITWYQKWVHWWNGKKTLIGLAGTGVGYGLTKIPDATTQAIGWILTALCGLIVTPVGAIHKIFKSANFGGKGEILLDNESFIALIKDTWEIIKKWINLIKGVKNGTKS